VLKIAIKSMPCKGLCNLMINKALSGSAV